MSCYLYGPKVSFHQHYLFHRLQSELLSFKKVLQEHDFSYNIICKLSPNFANPVQKY